MASEYETDEFYPIQADHETFLAWGTLGGLITIPVIIALMCHLTYHQKRGKHRISSSIYFFQMMAFIFLLISCIGWSVFRSDLIWGGYNNAAGYDPTVNPQFWYWFVYETRGTAQYFLYGAWVIRIWQSFRSTALQINKCFTICYVVWLGAIYIFGSCLFTYYCFGLTDWAPAITDESKDNLFGTQFRYSLVNINNSHEATAQLAIGIHTLVDFISAWVVICFFASKLSGLSKMMKYQSKDTFTRLERIRSTSQALSRDTSQNNTTITTTNHNDIHYKLQIKVESSHTNGEHSSPKNSTIRGITSLTSNLSNNLANHIDDHDQIREDTHTHTETQTQTQTEDNDNIGEIDDKDIKNNNHKTNKNTNVTTESCSPSHEASSVPSSPASPMTPMNLNGNFVTMTMPEINENNENDNFNTNNIQHTRDTSTNVEATPNGSLHGSPNGSPNGSPHHSPRQSPHHSPRNSKQEELIRVSKLNLSKVNSGASINSNHSNHSIGSPNSRSIQSLATKAMLARTDLMVREIEKVYRLRRLVLKTNILIIFSILSTWGLFTMMLAAPASSALLTYDMLFAAIASWLIYASTDPVWNFIVTIVYYPCCCFLCCRTIRTDYWPVYLGKLKKNIESHSNKENTRETTDTNTHSQGE